MPNSVVPTHVHACVNPSTRSAGRGRVGGLELEVYSEHTPPPNLPPQGGWRTFNTPALDPVFGWKSSGIDRLYQCLVVGFRLVGVGMCEGCDGPVGDIPLAEVAGKDGRAR